MLLLGDAEPAIGKVGVIRRPLEFVMNLNFQKRTDQSESLVVALLEELA